MAAAPPVDIELKKAFQELHLKVVDTRRRLRQADVQIQNLKKAVRHAQCTAVILADAPPSTKMYEAVGRLFVATDFEDIMKSLDEKIRTRNEKIKSIESSKTYLEKSLKESEDNIREMIAQKQSAH